GWSCPRSSAAAAERWLQGSWKAPVEGEVNLTIFGRRAPPPTSQPNACRSYRESGLVLWHFPDLSRRAGFWVQADGLLASDPFQASYFAVHFPFHPPRHG